MPTLTIGCRLPNGLVLEIPDHAPVTLKGQKAAQAESPIILLSERDCGYTDVDEGFWAEWKRLYKNFQPLTSHAIFEAKNRNDAKAVHKELKGEKTGHEPMPQNGPGIEKST